MTLHKPVDSWTERQVIAEGILCFRAEYIEASDMGEYTYVLTVRDIETPVFDAPVEAIEKACRNPAVQPRYDETLQAPDLNPVDFLLRRLAGISVGDHDRVSIQLS